MNRDQSLSIELREISILIKRQVAKKKETLPKNNITAIHGWIIDYLYRNQDKDIFQRDIEKDFFVRRSTTTSILQRMEKHGLISRQSVDNDARLKKIVLTGKAIELHKNISRKAAEFEKKLIKNITEEELQTLFTIMGKIKKNLE